MKELLPFIFAIGYFAFKQYKKGLDKKVNITSKDSHMPKNGNSEPKPPSLDDFITNFFGEQEVKPKVKFASENANDEYFEETVELMPQEKTQEPYSIEYNDHVDITRKEEKQFEMIKNKDIKLIQGVDFDLRKAIIYDAIINPPYISN